MNTNEEEIDLSLKDTIITQYRADAAVDCFGYEINFYKQKIDNDENIFDEDKLEIEKFIKKANELLEDWREISGIMGDFFSAQDELWDKEGELKPEYRN